MWFTCTLILSWWCSCCRAPDKNFSRKEKQLNPTPLRQAQSTNVCRDFLALHRKLNLELVQAYRLCFRIIDQSQLVNQFWSGWACFPSFLFFFFPSFPAPSASAQREARFLILATAFRHASGFTSPVTVTFLDGTLMLILFTPETKTTEVAYLKRKDCRSRESLIVCLKLWLHNQRLGNQ